MITYQELYDWFRKEKYSESLQTLPKGWLREVASYLREKEELVEKQEAQGSFLETLKLTKRQLENARAILEEMLSIRRRKVLTLAFTAVRTGIAPKATDPLLDPERKLFEAVCSALKMCESAALREVESEIKPKEESKHILVRFIEPVPAFLDENGNELGPFQPEDVANLPKAIASILIQDKKAVRLETE